MTALAKSTGDSTACMPSISDNNYVTQNKTGGKGKEKKKEETKKNKLQHTSFANQPGSPAQLSARFRNFEQDTYRHTNSLEKIPVLSCQSPTLF